MTSKWIKDISDDIDKPGSYTRILLILIRINNLLKKAMHSTDDERLYEDIEKEIHEN